MLRIASLALIVGVAVVAARVHGALNVPSVPPPEPLEPVASASGFGYEHWPPDDSARRGRLVYEARCIGCHGEDGRGDGAAARWLDPLPRDFQSGRFKFRSTPSGELPTREDLLQTVTCGLAGSSMPGFPLLTERQRRDVVEYVLYLATFGMVAAEVEYVLEDEEMTLEELLADELFEETVEEVLFDAFEEVWPLSVEPSPEVDDDLIARGRELYEAQCVACHGAGGRGDGSSSYALRDWKDTVVRPRDFTTGVFRAGSEPVDVFVRMKSGLNGTPMPSVYGSDEELWAITHYILSMVNEDSAESPHPTSCAANVGGSTR